MPSINKKRLIEQNPSSELYDDAFFLTRFPDASAFNTNSLAKREALALEYLSPLKGMRLLDVGCGSGSAVFKAAALGAKCAGFDYSKSGINIANKRKSKISKEIANRIEFRQMDVVDMKFPDNTFDRILSIDVIEHVYPEPLVEMFKEINRVTKPGGKIVMRTAPNKFFHRPFEIIAKLIFPGFVIKSEKYHVNVQTYFSLQKYTRYLDADTTIHLVRNRGPYLYSMIYQMKLPKWIMMCVHIADAVLDSLPVRLLAGIKPFDIFLAHELWIVSTKRS